MKVRSILFGAAIFVGLFVGGCGTGPGGTEPSVGVIESAETHDCFFDGQFTRCYDNDFPQYCETMICCVVCNVDFMVCEESGERCTCTTPCG